MERDQVKPRLDGFGQGETALILAAERLFAERGVDGVSLRQINQAADQKNTAAAHYHFGSKDGLVQAVLLYRLPRLDERRGELLRRNSQTKDLRFYLEAFVGPLAEELLPRSEGNYYIRFIQQYERHRGDYAFARQISPHGVEIYDGIERLLFYLPEKIRRLRVSSLINVIHSVLAITEERIGKGELSHEDVDVITDNILDMVAGALTAPPSAQTIGRLSA